MPNVLSIFLTIILFILFPALLFFMLVRALRSPGTRWWGIVILLSLLTLYCTTFTTIFGLIAGGGATGAAKLERKYCVQFCETLLREDSLPAAVARMDAASDGYRVKASKRSLRFRYVWLLGGCFLFAGANLMMFGKGRRERRNPADCIVMIIAALFVFLTGIWQIAWGKGYAFQAASTTRMLAEWHKNIDMAAIGEPTFDIAVSLAEKNIKNLYVLRNTFLELADGKKAAGQTGARKTEETPVAPPAETEDPSGTGDGTPSAAPDAGAPAKTENPPSVAIIGGADGPTAIVVGSGPEAVPDAEPDGPAKENAAPDALTTDGF